MNGAETIEPATHFRDTAEELRQLDEQIAASNAEIDKLIARRKAELDESMQRKRRLHEEMASLRQIVITETVDDAPVRPATVYGGTRGKIVGDVDYNDDGCWVRVWKEELTAHTNRGTGTEYIGVIAYHDVWIPWSKLRRA